MQVGTRQRIDDCSAPQFALCNNILGLVDVVNDLGVLIDPYLTFAAHIDSIVLKAAQRSYLIFKSFQSHDRDLLVKAYKTYVRPLLETNSQIWSPHLPKDIRRIEAVQRRFTKLVRRPAFIRLCGTSLFTWFKAIGGTTNTCRTADLLFAYKLLFGFTPLNVHEFFTPSRCTGTRGHAYKLSLTRCTTDVRKHFFCNRVAKIWNQLPIPISLVLLHSRVHSTVLM